MHLILSQRIRIILTTWLLFCYIGFPLADEPLPTPQFKTIWSANKKFYAEMDPEKKRTVIFSEKTGAQIWSMDSWHPVAELSNDGDHLVIGHPGINLLDLDYRDDEIILRFIRRGKIIASVTLNEIISEPRNLPRTVSHVLWGHYLGFDDSGRYLIETHKKVRFAFDPKTGKSVSIRK